MKTKMKYGWFIFIVLAQVLVPMHARAGELELSGGFNFNKSTYESGDFSWTRRWGASIGWHMTDWTEIELEFQDVTDRTHVYSYEDTRFHDRVYSADLVQSLLGRGSPIQPYVKVGIGELNRDAYGTYANGQAPPSEVNEVTGVLGGGLRLYFTRRFAIRAEGTTYLTGARIHTWKENVGATIGLSIFL